MSTNSAHRLHGYTVFAILKGLVIAAFFGTLNFVYGEIGFAIAAIAIVVGVAVVAFLVEYVSFRKDSGSYPS